MYKNIIKTILSIILIILGFSFSIWVCGKLLLNFINNLITGNFDTLFIWSTIILFLLAVALGAIVVVLFISFTFFKGDKDA